MMPADDLDSIAHLDFNVVRCQCENELCPNGCDRPATRHVEFHSAGDCNRPELGPFGNYLLLLCDRCLDTLKEVIDEQIARFNHPNSRAICGPCGAPLATREDWIREDRPL